MLDRSRSRLATSPFDASGDRVREDVKDAPVRDDRVGVVRAALEPGHWRIGAAQQVAAATHGLYRRARNLRADYSLLYKRLARTPRIMLIGSPATNHLSARSRGIG